MLRIVNVNCFYGLIHVVKNLTFHVDQGEIVTLIGANGAGKTTILRAISGLHPVKEGFLYLNGKDITHLGAEKLVRMGIAQVPEGRQIFRPMTVMENLEMGGYLMYRSQGRRQLRAGIDEMLEMFPKLKERRKQYAGTLSGGEQQMLAIAMALMSRPKLLLMDEPSMGLAPLIVRDILDLILRLKTENRLTVLLVEQNASAALKTADRGYVMETGRITLGGTAAALMQNQDVKRAYLGKDKREIWER